jgi:leucyl/phenylalanyl-tRNA--protein transferase
VSDVTDVIDETEPGGWQEASAVASLAWEAMTERLTIGVRACARFGGRVFSKLYRMFLERIALRLFRQPETAICYALNSMPPSPERVISNYCQGMVLLGKNIQGGLIWRTFPDRAIITPETAHIPKRLKGYMRRKEVTVRIDRDFDAVVRACQRQGWTWINEAVIDIYSRVFSMGFARSIEGYQDAQLVSGLWGLKVGTTFAVMSMFHQVDRAGAILFGALVEELMAGEWDVVDCGVQADHFRRFGAETVSRETFIEKVAHGLNPTRASGRAFVCR